MNQEPTAASANPTYVIGHRNPDADSICSAIAYAAYKEARGEKGHVAARCGNSNARIDTILKRFNQPLPLYLSDVSPRVRDLMVTQVVSITENSTCAEALELIDRHDIRILPVLNAQKKVVGTISLTHLGGIFIPRASEPMLMRKVETSLSKIVSALKGSGLHLVNPDAHEELYVRIGAMDIRSFGRVSETDKIPSGKSVIIVGDRWDIQRRAIELGVRVIIVTGNLPIDDEIITACKQAQVSLISSPFDSATTAWVVRTASTITRVVETTYPSIAPDVRIVDMRKKIAALTAPAFIVLNEDKSLSGVLSKSDVIKPVQTKLILVDHNELTQAVSGAEDACITEIIDHHRLGPFSTPQPILFINEPVGSTCTIIADLYRREGLTPKPEIAGLMMAGLISDTLHLNSPTTTPKDAAILKWLAPLAKEDPTKLAEAIFSSGSLILATTPDKVVRSDFKIYNEENVKFAVSQIEELGYDNFLSHSSELKKAVESLRKEERLDFTALLVTDINTQNSLLLISGSQELIKKIAHAHVEKDGAFELPGIVSRKKQLIPYLTSLLKEIKAEGI
ncbi:MAG: putative manganese-dependent inorganic diphosphatase [Verrucomicrobia bacterium]|jgi:manganese-dependent inorganic pyrophosphatase|nr:MAG: putative manganese-dependent inorganic diphosphatase [Verrucomicrobiota bacterium]